MVESGETDSFSHAFGMTAPSGRELQTDNNNRGDELLQSCLRHDSSLEEGARLSTIIEQKANSAQNAGAPTDTTQLIA